MKSEYNESQVKNCYDIAAEEYAVRFFHELDGKPFDRNFLTWFSKLIPAGEMVYEMGCGPGEISAFLKKQGLTMCGIDLSENMVAVANRLNPDIDFFQGNMLKLELEDASIFGIVAFYAIVHFSLKEVEVALTEFKRVLKDGGYLLFTFHVGDEVISTENFLEQENADADFVFFQVDDIIKIIEKLDFSACEAIVRYPYSEAEYPSKRAYILLQKET